MSKFGFSKRGSIQVSFSWIFMIIIGTFFIVLSYNIISMFQDNEETKYQIQLQQAMRTVLNNVGQTIGYEESTLVELDNLFKDSKVEILCEGDFPILSVNGILDANNQYLQNYPAFMTKIDEGPIPFTYLAVENFRMPFKVTNMLAIVSRKNLIVFDSESSITAEMREKFRKGAYRDSLNFMEDEFSNPVNDYKSIVKDENIQTIMFVSDKGNSLNLDDFPTLNVEAYRLEIEDLSGNDYMYGNLNYFDQNDNEFDFPFIDFRDSELSSKPLSLVTMAIFSRPSTFECSLNTIISETTSVFTFYLNKSNYLTDTASSTALCSSDFWVDDGNNFDGTLQELQYQGINDALESALLEIKNNKFNNIENLYVNINMIFQKASNIRDNSCEPIY